jgi:glycerol-3-phosphate dehydrogenase
MTAAIFERKQALQRLQATQFDVLVIGGGITGCGIARDAALRGLKVALVEKDDFASGTSSKSSKLVHGGLRYLEQGELKLVFESVNERKRLMQLARHLVRPLPFVVANYKGDRRWLLTLDIGLWLYEGLCLFQSYRNHQTFRAKRLLQQQPGLNPAGLNGGILYYDCLTDDARLTLENAIDAQQLGATVLNHVKVESLIQNQAGVVRGAVVFNRDTGERTSVSATVTINAAGPWSDEVRALGGATKMLKPSKGVHAVVDAARLPLNSALMMQSPKDKRVVFCIPWGTERSVIGTTDTFFEGSLDELSPTSADVDYLLETANHYFPSAQLRPDDVLSTWTGLRPLLAPDDQSNASQVSREHVVDSTPGFITVAGGKLTTYRIMAAQVVDAAMAQLQKSRGSTTESRPLPGAVGLTESDAQLDAVSKQLIEKGFRLGTAQFFAETYGARALDVAKRSDFSEQPIDPELPYQWCQVDEAVEHEFAHSLDDVMSRRLQLSLRCRDQGLSVAPAVAARMALTLGWTAARIEQELADFETQVGFSRAFRQRPAPRAKPESERARIQGLA